MTDDSVLDLPVFTALHGPQSAMRARWSGGAVAFDAEVSPFIGARDDSAESWSDLAELLGPGGTGLIAGAPLPLAAGWTETIRIDGYQMVGRDAAERVRRERAEPAVGADAASVDAGMVELGPEDAPAMLALATRTRPGPFGLRTRELGRFVGIRDGGVLVAMAGERMNPPGWREVSAVCTDDAYRGRGYAARLVDAVVAGIVARGELPVLHVAGANTGAVRLYEKLGFRIRRDISFVGVRAPEVP